MEQREEERARGVDTFDKAEHFIVDGSSACVCVHVFQFDRSLTTFNTTVNHP